MHDIVQGIFNLQPPFHMVVLIVVIVMGARVVTTLLVQIRGYACHRQELELKREMLDRGLSADEIEQIIRATPSDDDEQ